MSGVISSAPVEGEDRVQLARRKLAPLLRQWVDPSALKGASRRTIARRVSDVIDTAIRKAGLSLSLDQQTRLMGLLIEDLANPQSDDSATDEDDLHQTGANDDEPVSEARPRGEPTRERLEEARGRVQPLLMEQIDVQAASGLSRDELAREITDLVVEIGNEERLHLNGRDQRTLANQLLDDMVGLGPLEPLLADESITDIMVNGPFQVYVEKGGRLALTDVKFRDNAHVMSVATRIVTRIGRRIDESNPIADARLDDGSRVNIIAPPLALDGTSISIRKFSKKSITLDKMAGQGNLSAAMSDVLKIAARSRLNILISGGTGSGKTTLLNALSRLIDHGERIVTIEDAAELQLQQPHVVRLETRPANLEGQGEIMMRDLVKNALRMRPDRIVLGEVRGGEAIDMLQAMNTGHDGSMCTLHANTPREALTRLENMVAMSGLNLPSHVTRRQIADAADMVVQVERMRDGVRRITRVTEVIGMEEDVIVLKDLFSFKFDGEDAQGRLAGRFIGSGLRPHFLEKASYFGLDQRLLGAVS